MHEMQSQLIESRENDKRRTDTLQKEIEKRESEVKSLRSERESLLVI